jgi:hypothetical protein
LNRVACGDLARHRSYRLSSNRTYPEADEFHASVILGFTDTNALRAFFGSGEIAALSSKIPELVSAVHAYEVSDALTFVKNGKILPHYQA